jgi:ribosomal protein L11 methyltransferase
VGRSLIVCPPWEATEPALASGRRVLLIEPGRAFGTGSHGSTRGCLELLERALDGDAVSRALDVGCGSGILAIAAIQLGAAGATGLDTAPVAVEATLANARRNRTGRRLTARQGSVPSGQAPFDVVVANLVAGLLVELAEPLAAEVRPGGTLVASGIFRDRGREVEEAFGAVGLTPVRRSAEGDWVALCLARAA